MADINFNSILHQVTEIGSNIFGGLKEKILVTDSLAPPVSKIYVLNTFFSVSH